MDAPLLSAPREEHPGYVALTEWAPLPGLGVLPTRSFFVDGAEPMLIDTGIAPLAADFMAALNGITDPAKLRWVFMSHMDPDHTGALDAVLAAAPEAVVLTGMIGAAKHALLGRNPERVRVLTPGESITLGRRTFNVIRPPWFDAPETLSLVEANEGVYFCADAFATLLDGPATAAEDISAKQMLDGMTRWAEVDAPHLGDLDAGRFARRVEQVRALGPKALLSSHLPLCREARSQAIETAIAVQKAAARPLAAAA
jgi:glyoxylase-like metal-dependent hydrolase (beta-lactamase superfamily II)